MSAAILRRAASVLRERAANATSGPWAPMRSGAVAGTMQGSKIMETVAHTFPGGNGPKHNAHYIALMHPGVGLALADWLDFEAKWLDGRPRYTEGLAIAVARAVLGEQP